MLISLESENPQDIIDILVVVGSLNDFVVIVAGICHYSCI